MKLNFEKVNGLIPAIIQDSTNSQVLMLGYMNDEALVKTQKTGFVTFYSRTKKRLWEKGESSGNKLKVVSIKEDCDSDTLLIKVKPQGPICHTGDISCFKENAFTLSNLEEIIRKRKEEMPKNSYTSSLFKDGINKISQKVGEESVEVVIAAINESKKSLIAEISDLFFHTLVLMQEKKVSLKEVEQELRTRDKS